MLLTIVLSAVFAVALAAWAVFIVAIATMSAACALKPLWLGTRAAARAAACYRAQWRRKTGPFDAQFLRDVGIIPY